MLAACIYRQSHELILFHQWKGLLQRLAQALACFLCLQQARVSLAFVFVLW